MSVVQRLDPEAIARQHESSLSAVPESDREHAAQAVDEAWTMLLVEMHQDFRVAPGRESVTARLERLHELLVVVDFPVLDDPDRFVLVADRLVAAGEIDDRQAPRGEADVPVDERAAAVGASVIEALVHRLEDRRVHRSTFERRDATDAAHAYECSPESREIRCRGTAEVSRTARKEGRLAGYDPAEPCARGR